MNKLLLALTSFFILASGASAMDVEDDSAVSKILASVPRDPIKDLVCKDYEYGWIKEFEPRTSGVAMEGSKELPEEDGWHTRIIDTLSNHESKDDASTNVLLRFKPSLPKEKTIKWLYEVYPTCISIQYIKYLDKDGKTKRLPNREEVRAKYFPACFKLEIDPRPEINLDLGDRSLEAGDKCFAILPWELQAKIVRALYDEKSANAFHLASASCYALVKDQRGAPRYKTWDQMIMSRWNKMIQDKFGSPEGFTAYENKRAVLLNNMERDCAFESYCDGNTLPRISKGEVWLNFSIPAAEAHQYEQRMRRLYDACVGLDKVVGYYELRGIGLQRFMAKGELTPVVELDLLDYDEDKEAEESYYSDFMALRHGDW